MFCRAIRPTLSLVFLTIAACFLQSCGGGGSSSPAPQQAIVVEVSSPSVTTLLAGAKAVPLTATVSNDAKNAGVTWALTPSTCGSLSPSGTSATYTPPSESSLSADCTATITATSVSDTGRSAAVSLTVKAVVLQLPSGQSAVLSATASGATLTLSASVANDASGAATILWSIKKSGGSVRSSSRTAQAADTCGQLSASSGASIVYTPPANESCTAVVTATSSVNTSAQQNFTITVLLPTVSIALSPSTAQTLVAGAAALPISAQLTNDVQGAGAAWSQSNSSCGALSATSGVAINFTPVHSLSTTCTTTVTAAATADASRTASVGVTVAPIAVAITSPTTAPTVIASQNLPISASTNDPAGAAKLQWSLSGCGTLATSTGASVVYTAPKLLTASCTATATVSAATDSSKTATLSISATPITVSITSPTTSPSLFAGQQQSFSASTNDPAGDSALQWTLDGCGSLASTTGESVVYNAPKGITAACAATVSAHAATDNSRSSAMGVYARPITVNITSPTTVQAVASGAAAQAITATTDDPAGAAKLQWSLSGCGSLAATSGASDLYTPPMALASACTGVVSVSSSSDPSRAATATYNVTPAALTLTLLSPNVTATTVAPGGSLPLSVSLYNDAANGGVTATLNPGSCGSLSAMTLQSTSGATTTYTGQYTAGASACTTTLTLASTADASKKATIAISVQPPITVTLSPSGATAIDMNATLKITPTLTNDLTGKGVVFSLNPTTCGNLSASSATSGAVVTFTPAASCATTLTATAVADANKSATLAITVNPALSIAATVTHAGAAPYVGLSYTGYVTITGGGAPYQWSVSGLSNGLSSDAAGNTSGKLTISGSPTTAGVVSFSVAVTDATGANIRGNYTLNVATYKPPTLPKQAALGDGQVDVAYVQSLQASGGVAPYTFKVNSAAIASSATPIASIDGVTALSNGSQLSFSGTPTTAGDYTLDISVTDGAGQSAAQSYALKIAAAAPKFTITTAASDVPQGMVRMPYSLQFAAANGTLPYSFSFSRMPDGLTGYANGLVQGWPTAAGALTVRVTVTDAANKTFTANYTLSVIAMPDGSKNAQLRGPYACMLELDSDDATNVNGNSIQRGGMIFAFTTDGAGKVNKYEYDLSTADGGYSTASVTSGSMTVDAYSMGADNAGYLVMGTHVFGVTGGDINGANVYNQLHLVTMDDSGSTRSKRHGAGKCYRQNPPSGATAALNGVYLSGGYVFALRGEDKVGALESAVGAMQFDGAGAVTNAVQDTVDGLVYAPNLSMTIASATSADAFGRTLLRDSGGNTLAVAYITNQDAGQSVLMSYGQHSSGAFLIGEMRRQQTAATTSTPLSGSGVIHLAGAHTDASSNITRRAYILQYAGDDSQASLHVNLSALNNGAKISLNEDPAPGIFTYAMETSGRCTLASSGSALTGLVFYVYDQNAAVALFADADASGGRNNAVGWMDAQTMPNGGWTAASLAGPLTLSRQDNGDFSRDAWTAIGSLNSSGLLTILDQFEGNYFWANWQGENNSINGVQTLTFTPDATLDASSQYGAYIATQSQSGKTYTSHCVAISPSSTAVSGGKAAAVCLDDNSSSPQPILITE